MKSEYNAVVDQKINLSLLLMIFRGVLVRWKLSPFKPKCLVSQECWIKLRIFPKPILPKRRFE